MKTSINMNVIDWAAIVIVVVGALNWGLVGLAHFLTDAANWNIVNQLLGGSATVEFGVYVIVGLASLWTIFLAARLAGYGREVMEADLKPETRA